MPVPGIGYQVSGIKSSRPDTRCLIADIWSALTERPACFEIDPSARAVKQRVGCGSPTACAAATFSDRSPLHDVRQRARLTCRAEARDVRRAQRRFRTSLDPAGGARRDRTDDLLLAKQALSQLSYGPLAGISDQLPVNRI